MNHHHSPSSIQGRIHHERVRQQVICNDPPSATLATLLFLPSHCHSHYLRSYSLQFVRCLATTLAVSTAKSHPQQQQQHHHTVSMSHPPHKEPGWIRQTLHTWHVRHERLKHFVHHGMRYPLSKWGQAVMGVVYFSIPVVAGWQLMQWSTRRAEEQWQDKVAAGTVVTTSSNDEDAPPLAWGARLVTSDAETQEKNKAALNKFLQRQQRQKEKLLQQQQQTAAAANRADD
jgi:hypothetical protein